MTLMVKILKFNIRSFSRPDNFKTETYNFEEDKQDSDDDLNEEEEQVYQTEGAPENSARFTTKRWRLRAR